MLDFLIKRVATIVPTLVFVSMLIFGLQQLLPGDPAVILAGEERDANVVAYLHKKLHLDDPLPVRYAYWVGGVRSRSAFRRGSSLRSAAAPRGTRRRTHSRSGACRRRTSGSASC